MDWQWASRHAAWMREIAEALGTPGEEWSNTDFGLGPIDTAEFVRVARAMRAMMIREPEANRAEGQTFLWSEFVEGINE